MYVKNPLKCGKTMGDQGWISLDLSSFVLRKNGGFPCIVVIFSLKEGPFLYLTSLQTLYPFFYPNSLVTCSSYSPRNVARYKTNVTLWFPYLNPNTAAVLCSGWRREKEHAEVSIAAWKVILPLLGEQSLDKEKDIRDLGSNACVPNSGPAQA